MVQTDSPSEPQFAAFVAIDWADRKHAWSLQAAGSDQRESGEMKHTPEVIGAWVSMLSARFAGKPIAVALEQSHGALVFLLSQYANLHLYPIHPRAAAQFRAALYPSGAKDDPVDADLLLDMLVLHRKHIRPLRPDSEQTRLVQHQVQARRRLVNEKTRQILRLTAKLKIYFPQVLEWFGKVESPLVRALLRRWPTLPDLQRARPETIRSFFRRHNCRDAERIEERIQKIHQGLPAITDPAVVQPAVTATRGLLNLIDALQASIGEFDQQLAQATAEHPDFRVFDSFPGAGPALAPRLLAAFGSRRDRYAAAAEVQMFSGIAPIVKRSGKTESVHFRRACPKFVRQTFHEWAGHSIAFCDWARVFYQQKRQEGHDHHAAVRALAFKWIRIVYRCWKDGAPYDDARYVESLRRHGSPIAAGLAASTPK
jgi:transposase